MNAKDSRGLMRPFSTALAAIFLALGAAVSIAQTGTPREAPSIGINYYEIDTTTPEGVEALYERILEAAGQVCARFKSDLLTRQGNWTSCYSQAVNNAVAAVHKPMLTALHKKRRGVVIPRG
jgi:UrcA family protein